MASEDVFTDGSGVERIAGTLSGPGIGDVEFVQPADPGAVGASTLWLEWDPLTPTEPGVLRVRNPANTAWIPLKFAQDGATTETANVTVAENATSVAIETSDGAGEVAALELSANGVSTLSGGTNSGLQLVTDAGGLLGFFAASPLGQQVVPLTTPSVQDVIDALVAIGLIAQHD